MGLLGTGRCETKDDPSAGTMGSNVLLDVMKFPKWPDSTFLGPLKWFSNVSNTANQMGLSWKWEVSPHVCGYQDKRKIVSNHHIGPVSHKFTHTPTQMTQPSARLGSGQVTLGNPKNTLALMGSGPGLARKNRGRENIQSEPTKGKECSRNI